MKNILNLLLHFKFKELFFLPTNDTLLQSFRYLFVGGFSAVIDWCVLFILEKLGMHYLLATFFAFIAGLISNFVLSKRLVFKAASSRVSSKASEFVGYAIIGIIGLLITEALMFLFTDICSMYFMISKIIATLLVLIWNFTARKFILYKN